MLHTQKSTIVARAHLCSCPFSSRKQTVSTITTFGSHRSFLAGFQREAARSVSLAVDACTFQHKRAQQEVTARAAEALQRALELAGEEEVARTKAVLGR